MQLKDYSLTSIEKRFRREKKAKVKSRLHIVLLLREGYTQREVSNMLHVSVGIVPFWKKRFEELSFEGLEDKSGRGKKSLLNEDELSMLISEIDAGVALENGYRRGFKTKDVIAFIKDIFDIQYTSRHCRRILEKIGCSLIVPRPRNKRRNEQDVREFKNEFKKKENVWAMI